MSVEAIAIVLNHSRARGAAKLVLLGVANHISPDNDGAWPSQAKLAGYANVSDRAVRSAIDQLVELGELRVEHAGGVSANQYRPNRYWLTLRCPDDCDGTVNHRSRVEVSANRVEVSANRVEVSDARVEVSDIQGGSQLPLNRNRTGIEPKETKRGSRLPADWRPDPSLIEWARQTRPDIDVNLTTEVFIDYWHSKATNATKTDWEKTFKNWVRKERPAQGAPRQTNLQRNIDLVRRIADSENGGWKELDR